VSPTSVWPRGLHELRRPWLCFLWVPAQTGGQLSASPQVGEKLSGRAVRSAPRPKLVMRTRCPRECQGGNVSELGHDFDQLLFEIEVNAIDRKALIRLFDCSHSFITFNSRALVSTGAERGASQSEQEVVNRHLDTRCHAAKLRTKRSWVGSSCFATLID